MESSVLTHFDRRISMPPLFVDLTGSHAAAIMLTQLIYWHNRPRHPDRWTFKDQHEWYTETRLTWRQVNRIYKVLVNLKFIEVRRTPYKIGFRIIKDKLEAAILKAQGAQKIAPEPQKRINKMLNQQNVESTKCRINKTLTQNQQNVDSLPKRYIGTRAQHSTDIPQKLNKRTPLPPTPAAQGAAVRNGHSKPLGSRQQRVASALEKVDVQFILRKCGWSSAIAPDIYEAIEQYRRAESMPIADAAKLMAKNWRVWVDDARFMRHSVSPRNWIRQGLWHTQSLWPYDDKALERARKRF